MRALRAKRVALVFAAALAIAGAGVSVPSANAASPLPVAIGATVTIPNPIFGGVWHASGAINDSGTFVRTGVNLTGSFFNSPAVAAFQAELLFTGTGGTFTVRAENSFMASGTTGVWEIEAGTGAYQRLTGHGQLEFVFPDSIHLSGVLSAVG